MSRRSATDRGTALLLYPVGVLVLMVLAAIAVDFSVIRLARQELLSTVQAAADDSVGMVDEESLRAGDRLVIDFDRATRLVGEEFDRGRPDVRRRCVCDGRRRAATGNGRRDRHVRSRGHLRPGRSPAPHALSGSPRKRSANEFNSEEEDERFRDAIRSDRTRHRWRTGHRSSEPIDARAADSLRFEGEVLARIDHPGVVRLIADASELNETSIATAAAGQADLATSGPETIDELARITSSLATTLAELHRMGWSHGSVLPEHVIVGPVGRMTLCSLRRATRIEGARSPGATRDAAALADLIEALSRGLPTTTSAAGRDLTGRVAAVVTALEIRRGDLDSAT